MRYNSIGINWLRKLDKSLPTPFVIYDDLGENGPGGLHYSATRGGYYIDDNYKAHSLARGGIVVNINPIVLETISIEATLAHEWRHQWQDYQGWKYDGIGLSENRDLKSDEYHTHYMNYFNKSKSEMDALMFAYRMGTLFETYTEELFWDKFL